MRPLLFEYQMRSTTTCPFVYARPLSNYDGRLLKLIRISQGFCVLSCSGSELMLMLLLYGHVYPQQRQASSRSSAKPTTNDDGDTMGMMLKVVVVDGHRLANKDDSVSKRVPAYGQDTDKGGKSTNIIISWVWLRHH